MLSIILFYKTQYSLSVDIFFLHVTTINMIDFPSFTFSELINMIDNY